MLKTHFKIFFFFLSWPCGYAIVCCTIVDLQRMINVPWYTCLFIKFKGWPIWRLPDTIFGPFNWDHVYPNKFGLILQTKCDNIFEKKQSAWALPINHTSLLRWIFAWLWNSLSLKLIWKVFNQFYSAGRKSISDEHKCAIRHVARCTGAWSCVS
jgi:hypothetical protein